SCERLDGQPRPRLQERSGARPLHDRWRVLSVCRGGDNAMPRPIWTGSIAFGLVNVPVKVYSAVHQKEVRFHQLHDADGGRIQQKRVCGKCGREVAYENIVKGYELSPGRYVRIDP